jgi:hypothetical protein
VFDFGIQFRAEQHRQRRELEPQLQIGPSLPSVRRPPFFSCAIFRIRSWMIDSTSLGATRARFPVIASSRPTTGTKLTMATRNRRAGKSARKK